MKISELMTVDVLTVGVGTSLKEAARRMLEAGVSGLPVTGDDGELRGIITEADFVASEAERRAKQRAGLLRFFTGQHDLPDHELKVGDVMTTDLIVVSPDDDHADAARRMQKEHVKRLPVVEDGRLVGVVSRADMLRAFTRPDQGIIDEIYDHVMRRVLWIDPKRVTVESIEGNVVMRGKLETRTDAKLLVELTKRLDGVASVSDQLDWEVDNTKEEMVSPPPPNYPRGTRAPR